MTKPRAPDRFDYASIRARCCPRCGADPQLGDECWCERDREIAEKQRGKVD